MDQYDSDMQALHADARRDGSNVQGMTAIDVQTAGGGRLKIVEVVRKHTVEEWVPVYYD